MKRYTRAEIDKFRPIVINSRSINKLFRKRKTVSLKNILDCSDLSLFEKQYAAWILEHELWDAVSIKLDTDNLSPDEQDEALVTRILKLL